MRKREWEALLKRCQKKHTQCKLATAEAFNNSRRQDITPTDRIDYLAIGNDLDRLCRKYADCEARIQRIITGYQKGKHNQ